MRMHVGKTVDLMRQRVPNFLTFLFRISNYLMSSKMGRFEQMNQEYRHVWL